MPEAGYEVVVGEWDSTNRGWAFPLAKCTAIDVQKLLHGNTELARPSVDRDKGLLGWTNTNDPPNGEPLRVVVVVRETPPQPKPRSRLTKGKLAIITTALTVVGGVAGSGLTAFLSRCPGDLDACRGDLKTAQLREREAVSNAATLQQLFKATQ
jgi:hypothetical protein